MAAGFHYARSCHGPSRACRSNVGEQRLRSRPFHSWSRSVVGCGHRFLGSVWISALSRPSPYRTCGYASHRFRPEQLLLLGWIYSRSIRGSVPALDVGTQAFHRAGILRRQRRGLFIFPSRCDLSRAVQGPNRQDKASADLPDGLAEVLCCEARYGSLLSAEPADAQNAAIALRFHAGRHWRGVCDPDRWAAAST